jgi:hypothetical protein
VATAFLSDERIQAFYFNFEAGHFRERFCDSLAERCWFCGSLLFVGGAQKITTPEKVFDESYCAAAS